ncbi:TPA: ANTAR domain-containing response regulator, partial [Aeromonas hydrophila]
AMVQALARTESELRRQLVERRLIEQAKGRLMRHQGLDEEQAYRLMRSTAMSRHLSLGELARQLLLALPA